MYCICLSENEICNADAVQICGNIWNAQCILLFGRNLYLLMPGANLWLSHQARFCFSRFCRCSSFLQYEKKSKIGLCNVYPVTGYVPVLTRLCSDMKRLMLYCIYLLLQSFLPLLVLPAVHKSGDELVYRGYTVGQGTQHFLSKQTGDNYNHNQ